MEIWLEVTCSFVLCLFIIVAFTCIWSTSKFVIRLACYYFVLVCCPVFSIPLALFTPGDPGNLTYTSWLFRHCFRWVFGIEWIIRDSKHLKTDGACIFICNHQSAIDVQGMMCIWPHLHPCVPVMKRELLLSGPFGGICWLAGSVFLDRVNTQNAREMLNVKVMELKQKKVNLWIFPEGTRNDNGSLLPFKKGAFHIAVQAQIPVVPIVFSSYSSFYSVTKRIFNKANCESLTFPSPF